MTIVIELCCGGVISAYAPTFRFSKPVVFELVKEGRIVGASVSSVIIDSFVPAHATRAQAQLRSVQKDALIGKRKRNRNENKKRNRNSKTETIKQKPI